MKNTDTTTTSAVTVESLLKQATEPSKQNAIAFHDIWELGKRNLSVADQSRLWDGLTAIRKNDFAGKKFLKAHPEYAPSTPAWAKAPAEPKHPIPAPKAPAKQEKSKSKKAPAKQEKTKEPTTKEALARIFETMAGMDKTMRSMDKRLSAIEKKLAN